MNSEKSEEQSCHHDFDTSHRAVLIVIYVNKVTVLENVLECGCVWQILILSWSFNSCRAL